MKTTKDIAELLSAEIERIGKGEVRKDVITGLERCSNALIKLARLEMDFAWRDWSLQPPSVPWLSTHAKNGHAARALPAPSEETSSTTEDAVKMTTRQRDLSNQIVDCQKQMKGAGPTLKAILKDKITNLMQKLEQEHG